MDPTADTVARPGGSGRADGRDGCRHRRWRPPAGPRSALLIGAGCGLAGDRRRSCWRSAAAPAGRSLVDGGAPLGSRRAAGSSAAPSADRPVGLWRAELVVEIVGAVDQPGVFRLPAGSRVGDLVDAAGGYGPRVDAGRASRELNLAAPLHDGDQVRVPSRDDAGRRRQPTRPAAPSGGIRAPRSAPLDLNRATRRSWRRCPGSARSRRPRSWPPGKNSRSRRSRTCGPASWLARRRSRSSRTS